MTLKQKINSGLLTLSIALFGFMFVGLAESVPANAQAAREQACIGAHGEDAWQNGKCVDDSGFTVEGIVESVLDILYWVVGVASVIMLIIGGIRYVVSAGDQNAVTGAKNTILYAIVGLVIAFAAFAISNFVINRVGEPVTEDDDQSAIVRVIA